MKKIILCCLLFIVHCSLFSQNPVLLQPWVEVYGTTAGSQLGKLVRGIEPSSNFSYRASVVQSDSTGFYKLQNKNDISPYLFINNPNILQTDLNVDGNTDLILTKAGVSGVDTVIIYWGTSEGIDSINVRKFSGDSTHGSYGLGVCVANLVGDSLPDLIVPSPGYNKGQGKVEIFRGDDPFPNLPYLILYGDSIRYFFGNSATGDLNNDGYIDLIVRSYNEMKDMDYVDIYYGGSVFDTVRDIRITGKHGSGGALACFDANGDGIEDLLWTNRDSATVDRVYIHFGGSSFSTTPDLKLQNPGVSNFGNTITNAGDMNGDGYNDIAVGAYKGSITNGYVFIFGGGPKINDLYDASYSLSTDGGFGASISSVGDINGDGLGDIIVGAPDYPFTDAKGYWGIFLGSTNIKVTSVEKEQPAQPQFFELYQNYPNPFNGETVFSYSLHQDSAVRITITNSLGQEVTVLPQSVKHEGFHTVRYNAKDLTSGWYVFTLRLMLENGQTFSQSRAMIVEK